MRFGFVLLMLALSLLPTAEAFAHPADEFPQVTLQVSIDDEAVALIVGIPAKTAKFGVFDGLSPVAMDQMEPEELAKVIAPVLATRCPVMIDGVEVLPTIIGPVVDMKNSRLPARRFPEAQTLEQGTLRFVARYETKGPPSRVALDWSIYSNRYDEAGKPIHDDADLMVAALVAVDKRENFVFLTPMEPGYTWHSDEAAGLQVGFCGTTALQEEQEPVRVPVPSIVIVLTGVVCGVITLGRSKPRAVGLMVFSFVAAGACLPYGNLKFEQTPAIASLADEEALSVFESLHRNIYRAFDYTDEGAVYDALAQSVDGPMLETIYNDVYQSLIMREENGAVSKVVRVEVEDAFLIEPIDEAAEVAHGPSAYVVHCAWQVDGLVTHFGHTHARTNAFTAVYTVAPRADGWRIVDAEILDQRRIDDGQQTAEDLLQEP